MRKETSPPPPTGEIHSMRRKGQKTETREKEASAVSRDQRPVPEETNDHDEAFPPCPTKAPLYLACEKTRIASLLSLLPIHPTPRLLDPIESLSSVQKKNLSHPEMTFDDLHPKKLTFLKRTALHLCAFENLVTV
mmetsp:Transcript_50446/g.99296  ORF Transcript_50446/g.99296 Transcript_50446/m.99296 type:complete len:135 (-) Transcript_50446:45-449(-)